ncbi:MAG: cytochrome P460 family protein [Betaproteobacteria bacterium]|nr:cytochrome P460 family protein [Betaproteobacteria bacterium]
MKSIKWGVLALVIAGCASAPPPAPAPKLNDGELALPGDYKSWKAQRLNVQRADVKQVRDVYLNDIGAKAPKGGKFGNGTVAVMELYAAKAGADGALEKGADGNLVKGNLLKVFVMGKGEGWGADATNVPKNGDWVYGAYLADGKKAPDPIAPCRTCHLNNIGEAKDYVASYTHFDSKK